MLKTISKVKSAIKFFTFFTILTIAILPAFQLSQPQKITVTLNGNEVTFDQPPIMVENRVFIPVRKVSELTGASVAWNQNQKEATIKKDNDTILIRPEKRIVAINGKNHIMDTPGKLVNGRIIVPIRFIAETLKYNVTWDAQKHLVNITKKAAAGMYDKASGTYSEPAPVGRANPGVDASPYEDPNGIYVEPPGYSY